MKMLRVLATKWCNSQRSGDGMDRYNGMKKAGDWIGKKVVTTQALRNGLAELPAGTSGTVRGCARGALNLDLHACECCKIKLHITRVSYFDVSLAV